MPRPSLLLRALVVASTTAISALTLGAAPAPASPETPVAAAPAARVVPDTEEPLTLRMRSITPDYVPDHGPVVVHGTITNSSRQKWTAINVHGFISSAPMTTAAELAEAVEVPTTTYVGDRITVPGTFDRIDILRSGQTKSFTVSIPRSDLNVTAPGVYWFGVHALGTSSDGRPDTAVGRDRTFLPLVANPDHQVDTALVVPVRAAITHAPDGSLEDPTGWAHSVAAGPLRAVVQVGRAAQGRPLTWLLDPAVLDAVRQLAAGNPARSLGVPDARGGTPSATPSSSPSASVSGTASGSSVGAQPSASEVVTAGAIERGWLRGLHGLVAVATNQILGLPYGDLAVDSVSRYDHPLLGAAIARTGHTLAPWGLPVQGAVSPPSGGLDPLVIDGLPAATRVLLSDRAVTGTTPTVNRVSGRSVVLASSGAATGGPGPRSPLGALALRQRILSEAALRLNDSGQPLVVELPHNWAPRHLGSFFDGLDVPWLRLTTLDQAVNDNPPAELPGNRLRSTPLPSSQDFEPDVYTAANKGLSGSRTLGSMLATRNELPREIFAETTSNASYAAREDPYSALARLRSIEGWVSTQLAAVRVQAPESVTLASSQGRFSAVVTNDLDVPVTVEVRAVADPQLRITGGETVQLPPHGRTTILLEATTHRLGVHQVTLELATPSGETIGSADAFPIRAEQVSELIWVIIGAGVGLLFTAIVIRLVRRIVRSRA